MVTRFCLALAFSIAAASLHATPPQAAPRKEKSVLVKPRKPISVQVQVYEVDLKKIRQLGFDFSQTDGESGMKSTKQSVALLGFVQALEKSHCAKNIAATTLIVSTGRTASMHSGGTMNVPKVDANGRESFQVMKLGTTVEVTAENIGENRVRLNVHPRVTEVDMNNAVVVNGQKVPKLSIRECDFSGEANYNQPLVFTAPCSRPLSTNGKKSGKKTSEDVLLVAAVTPATIK